MSFQVCFSVAWVIEIISEKRLRIWMSSSSSLDFFCATFLCFLLAAANGSASSFFAAASCWISTCAAPYMPSQSSSASSCFK